MFNLDAFEAQFPPSRRLGALAFGLITFAGAATAAPLPLFPFILTPPAAPSAPPPCRPPRPKTKTPWLSCRRG